MITKEHKQSANKMQYFLQKYKHKKIQNNFCLEESDVKNHPMKCKIYNLTFARDIIPLQACPVNFDTRVYCGNCVRTPYILNK